MNTGITTEKATDTIQEIYSNNSYPFIKVIKYKPSHTETILSLKGFIEKYKINIENALSNFIIENEESLPSNTSYIKEFLKNFIYNFNNYAYVGLLIQDNKEYEELGSKGYVKVNTYNLNTYTYEIKEMEFIHILPVEEN